MKLIDNDDLISSRLSVPYQAGNLPVKIQTSTPKLLGDLSSRRCNDENREMKSTEIYLTDSYLAYCNLNSR